MDCLEAVVEILSPKEDWEGKEGSQDDKMKMFMEWATEGLLINPINGRYRIYRKKAGKITTEDGFASETSGDSFRFRLGLKIDISKIIKAYKDGERKDRELQRVHDDLVNG
jgi:Uma2 family endonuclease